MHFSTALCCLSVLAACLFSSPMSSCSATPLAFNVSLEGSGDPEEPELLPTAPPPHGPSLAPPTSRDVLLGSGSPGDGSLGDTQVEAFSVGRLLGFLKENLFLLILVSSLLLLLIVMVTCASCLSHRRKVSAYYPCSFPARMYVDQRDKAGGQRLFREVPTKAVPVSGQQGAPGRDSARRLQEDILMIARNLRSPTKAVRVDRTDESTCSGKEAPNIPCLTTDNENQNESIYNSKRETEVPRSKAPETLPKPTKNHQDYLSSSPAKTVPCLTRDKEIENQNICSAEREVGKPRSPSKAPQTLPKPTKSPGNLPCPVETTPCLSKENEDIQTNDREAANPPSPTKDLGSVTSAAKDPEKLPSHENLPSPVENLPSPLKDHENLPSPVEILPSPMKDHENLPSPVENLSSPMKDDENLLSPVENLSSPTKDYENLPSPVENLSFDTKEAREARDPHNPPSPNKDTEIIPSADEDLENIPTSGRDPKPQLEETNRTSGGEEEEEEEKGEEEEEEEKEEEKEDACQQHPESPVTAEESHSLAMRDELREDDDQSAEDNKDQSAAPSPDTHIGQPEGYNGEGSHIEEEPCNEGEGSGQGEGQAKEGYSSSGEEEVKDGESSPSEPQSSVATQETTETQETDTSEGALQASLSTAKKADS